eukprot:TRINITY_DN21415_c0_g2_i1.p1 TRINITY_DN21415_c0_g2~~TRINITY_DN21415_c0_g2_i1.p1  ORF type:complete len:381 (+),score=81.01 TRINITY_DN21415_c0_g2_i1:217-1359(+)
MAAQGASSEHRQLLSSLELDGDSSQQQGSPRWWALEAYSTGGILGGVALVSTWWLSAIAVTVVLKRILASEGCDIYFPFPFALTCITNSCAGLLALLASCATTVVEALGAGASKAEQQPLPPLRWEDLSLVICIGLLQGVEIGCNNKSLEFLTVSKRTMINSTSVLFVMVVAYFLKLERLGYLRLTAALCLCFGALLQGVQTPEAVEHPSASGLRAWFGDIDRNQAQGVMLQMAAMTIAAFRWAMTQMAMASKDDSALGRRGRLWMASRILPVTSGVCCALSILFEAGAFSSDVIFKLDFLASAAQVGTFVMLLIVSEFWLVRLTSAVALQVLSALHQIPIVLAGVVFFGDRVSVMGIFGFGLCLVGALCYAAARVGDSH